MLLDAERDEVLERAARGGPEACGRSALVPVEPAKGAVDVEIGSVNELHVATVADAARDLTSRRSLSALSLRRVAKPATLLAVALKARAASLLLATAFVTTAGCSLISLDGFVGDSVPGDDASADRDGAQTSDAPGSTPDGTADGPGPSDICGLDAIFCTQLPGPALAEWSTISELGGSITLDQAFSQSPPSSLRATMPAQPAAGAGGYAAAVKKIASPPHVVDEVSFSFRHTGMPSASVGIARLTVGISSNELSLIVSTTASSMVVRAAFGSAPSLDVGSPVALPPAGAWTRITLRLERAVPSVLTLEIDEAVIFSQKPVTSSTYGTDIALELGLVSVGAGTSALDVRFDDVAIRRR